MTNTEMIKKMVKQYGLNAILDMARISQSEIEKEEASYRHIISPMKYSNSGRKADDKISFPKWVDETFQSVLAETGVISTKKGDGKSTSLTVTREDFAKYVIQTCNDDGETLRNIIKILLSAPAWSMGYGMTRSRMELVFHILVLHRNNTKIVIKELEKFLNKYDPTALKVYANGDDAFRHTLNHEIQMIAYTERYICGVINDEVKFEYKSVA